MTANVKKHFSLSPILLAKSERKAKKLGVPFTEYLRYLLIRDTATDETAEDIEHKKWENGLPVYTATDEKWQEWDEAEKEDGVVMTSEEFDKYLQDE